MNNNKIKTLVISALMVVSALGPQKSHAVVGIATGAIPAIIIGGILLGCGVGIEEFSDQLIRYPYMLKQPPITLGPSLSAIGFTLLPTESNSVVLPELNEINSLSLGLTDAELKAYQSEKMDLDVLFQDLNDVARSAETPEMRTLKVAAEFENQKSRFSPHTLSALMKILQPKNTVQLNPT